jgi:hypothetical protein
LSVVHNQTDRTHLPATGTYKDERCLVGDNLQLDREDGARFGALVPVTEIPELDHGVALVVLPVRIHPGRVPVTVSVATGQLTTGNPSS